MDVAIPRIVAEQFADVLAPIGQPCEPRAEAIGFALRAAAHGVQVDWPRVIEIPDHIPTEDA